MIINNNLMAANTHRQLGLNNAAGQKSIEKLSSGFRINRAGDDAAGLAISEKMRGQIRGLNQAARNAQDGISMIQTAEGALSETHAILQRMRELAVQASNSTNAEVDRGEIQKEINQLTCEINRIANATEFNTMSLLNGDIAIIGDGRVAVSGANYSTGLSGLDVNPTAALDIGSYQIDINSSSVNQVGEGQSTTLPGEANTVVTGADVSLTEGSYQVKITNEKAKALVGAPGGDDTLLNAADGNEAISIQSDSTLANEAHSIDATKEATKSHNPSISADGITNVVPTDAEAGPYVIETAVVLNDAEISGAAGDGQIMHEPDGAISNFQIPINSTLKAADDYSIKVTQLNNDRDTDGFVQLKFELIEDTNGTPATVQGTTINFSATSGAKTVKLGDITFDIDSAKVWASDKNGDKESPTSTFHNNTITFSANAIQNKISVTYDGDTDNTKTVTLAQTGVDGTQTFPFGEGKGGTLKLDYTAADFVGDMTHTTSVNEETTYIIQLKNNSNENIGDAVELSAADIAKSANVTNIALGGSGSGLFVDFSGDELAKMSPGTKTITFTVGEATKNTAQLQNADGTDFATPAGKFTLSSSAGTTVVDLGEGVTFSYEGDKLGTDDGSHFFSVKAGAEVFAATLTKVGEGQVGEAEGFNKGDTITFGTTGLSINTDSTVVNGGQAAFDIIDSTVDNSVAIQIGANHGQSMNIDINNMSAAAIKISGGSGKEGATVESNSGAKAAYTTTKAVNNGTTSIGTEYALDVTTHENASAAIDVFSDAVELVSAERSKLGAFQNRLEHTINNLNTSSENLQASESRIRDVDMAKEMVEFTKNNILQQTATAMLAQANNAPQSVLQLLR